MKYLLITQRSDLDFSEKSIEICDKTSIRAASALQTANHFDVLAVDIETTGLNVWKNHVVLVAIYHPKFEEVIVIDTETVPITILNQIDWKNKTLLAHSAAFETKFLLYNGVKIYNVWCTLVAEQKLLQGGGFSMSLVNTLDRRGISRPYFMDKDVRNDFIHANYSLQGVHVLYNASDVLPLHELMEKQKLFVEKFNLNFFIRSIHMPLILVLVRMELEGFLHDSELWNKHADETEAYCTELNNQLNELIMDKVDWQYINSDYKGQKEKKLKGIAATTARLGKLKSTLIRMKAQGKDHLKSFKTNQENYIRASEALEKYQEIEFDNMIGINWASSKQVLAAFTELGMNPLPQAKSTTTHKMQPSTSVAAREAWLLENKTNPFYDMMVIFDKMQGKLHNVKSFGRKWVEKYTNPVTGKVHTTYRNDAATGRLTSGNASEGLYNSQQIPAETDFRHSFIAKPGYSIYTGDYSGAELCFMCVIANDEKLIELSKGDMHSYFANKGWKAIIERRGGVWQEEDIISKNQNKQKRTDYKPMMFGTVYGLRDKKAAETLNVSVSEGQIAIDSIIDEIPKTIEMVEAATAFAKAHGYVIHNDRTNSRRWFPAVLYAKANNTEMNFMERKEVEGASRNTRIQGSQADLIMEALVVIQRWIDIFKIDAQLMITVHDEIVIQFRNDLNWFPKRVTELMERTAVLYTKNIVELKVDYNIEPYWTK